MDAWFSSGFIRLTLGDWSLAVEHFAHAMRLRPFDPLSAFMQQGTAIGYFFTGRYDEAAVWSAKSIAGNPNPSALRITAASNAFLGRQEQAQKAIVRLRELEPAVRIETIKYAFSPPPVRTCQNGRGSAKRRP